MGKDNVYVLQVKLCKQTTKLSGSDDRFKNCDSHRCLWWYHGSTGNLNHEYTHVDINTAPLSDHPSNTMKINWKCQPSWISRWLTILYVFGETMGSLIIWIMGINIIIVPLSDLEEKLLTKTWIQRFHLWPFWSNRVGYEK